MTTCQGSKSFESFRRGRGLDKHEQQIQFGLLAASLPSNAQRQGEMQMWDSVPEDILWNILRRLPLVTQCRFRIVCTKWKRLLLAISDAAGQPLRPTCTFRSGGESSYACFYCSDLRKWFRLPFQPWRRMPGDWVLMTTDGGLLCFVNMDGRRWELLLCNPVTGSYVKILPEHRDRRLELFEFSNLIVNLETKSFKLVFMSPDATAVFDSKSLEWKRFQAGKEAFPDLPWVENSYPGFVWKGKIYKQAGQSRSYLAFDLESGTWSALQDIGFPSGCDMTHFFHLESWKDQVVLAQLHPNQEDPVRVWMLRDGPDAALTWEKVPIEIPDKMRILVYELQNCLSHGHEYICFTTHRTDHWVKYTFKTRSWQVMPRPGNRDADPENLIDDDFPWGNFEPQTFINPKADNHSIRFDGSKFLTDGDDGRGEHFDNSDSEGDHTDGSDFGYDYPDYSDAERDHSDGSDFRDGHSEDSAAEGDHSDDSAAEGDHSDDSAAEGDHSDDSAAEDDHPDDSAAEGDHSDDSAAEGAHSDDSEEMF